MRLSLVSIGVELYAATANAEATALHQIHKPSGTRVRYEKVVPRVGPIQTSNIVKGFEIDDDFLCGARTRGAGRDQAGKQPRDRAGAICRPRRDRLVAEVAYAERTADGYLHHPSFIGLREDKPASQVKAREAMKNDAAPKREDRRLVARDPAHPSR